MINSSHSPAKLGHLGSILGTFFQSPILIVPASPSGVDVNLPPVFVEERVVNGTLGLNPASIAISHSMFDDQMAISIEQIYDVGLVVPSSQTHTHLHTRVHEPVTW